MIFYLGSHRPEWLGWPQRDGVPLFVSRRRIERYKKYPRAIFRWALDSGGFTEVSQHGGWTLAPRAYAAFVKRCIDDVGMLDWAAPMDWMCEPFVLKKTGKTLEEHQRLTVENFLELKSIAPDLPWVPVVQGFAVDDYQRCADSYESAGVDLASYPLVGVGSVCRRQAEKEAEMIFEKLFTRGLALHGFGIKVKGFARYQRFLASSDSMAWSYSARRGEMLPGCSHGSYNNCANCILYALDWHRRFIGERIAV